ncbi:MAG: hypothetical protein ACE5JI_02575 [Acidobacteriota bacterium]
MAGVAFSLAFLALTASVSQSSSEKLLFWLEARGLSSQEVQVLGSSLDRMARRSKSIAPAMRREDADLFLRLNVGTLEREAEVEDFFPGLGRESLATPGEQVEDVASPTRQVKLELVDILNADSLFERSLRCRLPLTRGNIVSDHALRANLSHAVDLMKEWAGRKGGLAVAPHFGPSEVEREGLSGAEQARALYREGVRASRAGFQEVALNLMAEAQPLFKQTGLRKEEGQAWEHLALLTASTGRELEKAISYARQAVKIAREVSDPRAEAWALLELAVLEAQAANYPRALQVAQAALKQSRARGELLAEAAALANMAGLTAIRGNFEDARRIQEQALELIRKSGNRWAEGRLRLAMAAVYANLDERDRAATLAEIRAVRELARELGDLALEKDAAFVQADVRYSTTDLRHLMEGELDTIRALKLAGRLGDRRGEAAALALLGAFSNRLGKPRIASEYLFRAHQEAQAAGFREAVTDSLQLLGEIAPNIERGISLLEGVAASRREAKDLRGQIKTLSDLCRLYSGLSKDESAWQRYREAVAVLADYAAQRTASPYVEDIQESFLTVVKSLMTTRTELPFLARYLKLDRMLVMPDPSWWEKEG